MTYDKQIRIESGVHIEDALIVLRNFKQMCVENNRKIGHAGGCIYVMNDGSAIYIYHTTTAYIIRKG